MGGNIFNLRSPEYPDFGEEERKWEALRIARQQRQLQAAQSLMQMAEFRHKEEAWKRTDAFQNAMRNVQLTNPDGSPNPHAVQTLMGIAPDLAIPMFEKLQDQYKTALTTKAEARKALEKDQQLALYDIDAAMQIPDEQKRLERVMQNWERYRAINVLTPDEHEELARTGLTVPLHDRMAVRLLGQEAFDKRQKAALDLIATREEEARKAGRYPFQVREDIAKANKAEQEATGTQPLTPYQTRQLEQSAETARNNVNSWIRTKNDPNSTEEQKRVAEANLAEYQKLHPGPQAAMAPGATATDPEDIANAIMEGRRNPSTKGLYKTGVTVDAILARKGYNKAQAEMDWNAINRHLATLNSASQERLRQAIDFTYHSLDQIDDLYKQWTAKGLNTRFGGINKLGLAAAKQLGGEAGAIAQGLETQINDLTSEMATVYKGGNASTDEGLRLASENLKGNWNEETFHKSMALLRNNLKIRRNSILNSEAVGVSPGSPYLPAKTETPAAGKRRPLSSFEK